MRKVIIRLLAAALVSTVITGSALAEVKEVRIAKQYGLAYLPLVVVEERQLIEKAAKAEGLGEIKTSWVTLGGGASANDALISGSVDYISGGAAPFIILWDKTKGKAKALAALDHTPIYLNTTNPNIKSVKDFTSKDRIAVPSVKVSIQAILLQMAAAKEFGQEKFDKLDPLTVSLKHPDALVAFLSGKSEVDAHFATPPYSFQELENPKVHRILSSYDLLGGPHTMNVLTTTTKFHSDNPKVNSAVLDALENAIAWIKSDKKAAAELYVKATKSTESVTDVLSQLNNEDIDFDTAPLGITKFYEFLYKIGTIDSKPKDWKELFFPDIHKKKGN